MLKLAKGFRLRRSSHYRYASDAVDHGMQYAYRDRKAKKRTFRYLWQIRINAAARAAGLTYSRFMEGLKAAGCSLDRKVLADIAATDAGAFAKLVEVAQVALKGKPGATTQAVAAGAIRAPISWKSQGGRPFDKGRPLLLGKRLIPLSFQRPSIPTD
jgi:large subunit ribosomal protein L20